MTCALHDVEWVNEKMYTQVYSPFLKIQALKGGVPDLLPEIL